jgi:hypothetical protein
MSTPRPVRLRRPASGFPAARRTGSQALLHALAAAARAGTARVDLRRSDATGAGCAQQRSRGGKAEAATPRSVSKRAPAPQVGFSSQPPLHFCARP